MRCLLKLFASLAIAACIAPVSSASEFRAELPAGPGFALAPVAGYVDGWWNQMLANGPTGLLLAAGDRNDFNAWLRQRDPRGISISSRYEFVENDGATQLFVFLKVDGVDSRYQAAIGDLVDRFIEDRLTPYITHLYQRQRATGELPAP